MPENIRDKIQAVITDVRDVGGVVNTITTQAIITGVLKSESPMLLRENGGPIDVHQMYAWRFLDDMGWTKRAVNGDKGSLPGDWESKKEKFINDVKTLIQEHNIPDDLVVNFDQTGVKLVPTSDYTFAPKGTHDVSATGSNDKREITAVVAGTKSGLKLPPQLIYSGKTQRCLPKLEDGFELNGTHLTMSDSHWSTEQTMIQYIDLVLKPYISETRKKLNNPSAKALLLLDVYKVHQCDTVIAAMKALNGEIKFIPGSMTSKCQPMDLSVNKSLKSQLKNEFNSWYGDEVKAAIDSGMDKKDVSKSISLAMSRVKPLATKWFIKAWRDLPDSVISNGFREAGL